MVAGEKPTQTARCVSVEQTDNGMVTCSVVLSHTGGMKENVPYLKPANGAMFAPQQGDTVVIEYMEDGNPYISGILSVPSKDYQAPQLAEGSMSIRFDDQTEISVKKDGSGNYDVSISASGQISLSASGDVSVDGENVSVSASGDASVSASGAVSVDAADAVDVDGSTITLDSTGNATAVDLGPNGDALVTDIETTTDNDGHVTGITLIKTSKTKAE